MRHRSGFVRGSLADAEASMDAFPTDRASARFNAVLDPETFEVKRYEVARIFDAP
jgi:hypothetical protein